MTVTSTLNLDRDAQITLLALFPRGRDTVEFRTKDRISQRSLAALERLTSLQFIKSTPLGSSGVRYEAIPKQCGYPLVDLAPIEEHEDFNIFQ